MNLTLRSGRKLQMFVGLKIHVCGVSVKTCIGWMEFKIIVKSYIKYVNYDRFLGIIYIGIDEHRKAVKYWNHSKKSCLFLLTLRRNLKYVHPSILMKSTSENTFKILCSRFISFRKTFLLGFPKSRRI